MSNKTVTINLPIFTIFLIVFVVLKLCNVITWSWWWVLSPIWIGAAWILLGVIFWFIIYVITGK